MIEEPGAASARITDAYHALPARAPTQQPAPARAARSSSRVRLGRTLLRRCDGVAKHGRQPCSDVGLRPWPSGPPTTPPARALGVGSQHVTVTRPFLARPRLNRQHDGQRAIACQGDSSRIARVPGRTLLVAGALRRRGTGACQRATACNLLIGLASMVRRLSLEVRDHPVLQEIRQAAGYL